MTEPIKFPVGEDAKARLAARVKPVRQRAKMRQAPGVVTHPRNRAVIEARIKEEEKQRAMPETLMLWVVVSVAVLTVVPVVILAFVGY